MAFSGLTRIRTIDLSGNPIECACRAMYLHEFFSEKRLASPICQEPEVLRGMPLLALNTSEICVSPTARITSNEDIVLSTDMLLELNCNTTGIPPPRVIWSRDGMTLSSDDSRIIIMGGTLLITETRATDSGEYHCFASSAAGSVSSSVEVTVLESTEASTTLAVVRENAVLECSSQVPPGVSVRWMFNNSTLAPLSDKYVLLRNGSLLILDLWVEDMGDYLCQIGQVILMRTLNLTARPEITFINEGRCEEPSTIMVQSNRPFTFTCEVFGIPAPTVSWCINGVLEVVVMPEEGLAGGAVVANYTISNPTELNEGIYICMGTNDIGNVSAMVNVVVQILTFPSLEGRTVQVGDTVILECLFPGAELGEANITWTRLDGQQLPMDRINFTCSNRNTLIITNISQNDNAVYTCQVGGNIDIFSLTVVQVPEIQKECATPTITTRVGENITLQCNARGNPLVDLRWFRGGEEVRTGGRVTLIEGGARLNISDVREADIGLYNCTVSNNINGVDFSESYQIMVDVQRPPFFRYRPSSITVLSGNMAVFFCGGGGNPAPTVTWHRQLPCPSLGCLGKTEPVVSGGRISIANQFLLFTETQVSDEGFYLCSLSSPLGNTTSRRALLNVYSFPSATLPQSQVSFGVGVANAVLECNGSGDPRPDTQWLRLPDMNIIPSQSFPNYVENGSNLVILNVSIGDAGGYRCWVANAAGQVFQDVNVSVITPPETSVEPESVRANVGCQVVLTCLDGGKPPVNFRWSFNDMSLQTRPGVLIRDTGELVLSDLVVEDSGNYSCTVQGMLHNTSRTAVLRVTDPLFPDQGPPSRPFIISPTPSRQMLLPDQTVQFVCLVQGIPSPQVSWLKDQVPIDVNDTRIEGDMSMVLVISNITVDDDGIYTCMASNSQGSDSKNFTLLIAIAPEITAQPQPLVVDVHVQFSLNCSVSGRPQPTVFWLLNDTVLMTDERRSIDPKSHSLGIVNASMTEDSGFYTCFTLNDAGTDEYTVSVQVMDQVMAPLSFRVTPQSVTTKAGSPVVLDCIVDGFPRPTVSWFRDGFPLWPCPEVPHLRICVQDRFSINIRSAREADSGVYRCDVMSEAGSLSHTAVITILPRRTVPFFLMSPIAQHVVQGTMVILDCVAGGSPQPNITWLRNMNPLNTTSGEFVQLANGSLLLTSAQENTVGYFTCSADNGVGCSKMTVSVELIASTEPNSTVGLSRPVLTSSPLGSLTVFSSQSRVVLDCVGTGSPRPLISWTRNGVPIDLSSSPSLRLANNGSLILANLSQADEGNYSCVAFNQEGSYEVHFAVDVIGQSFIGGEERVAFTGSHMNIDPPSISSFRNVSIWKHKDRVMHETDAVKMERNGSLTFSSVQLEDAGHYKHLSATSRGWRDTDFLLHVEPKREPPFFTLEPGDVHLVKKGFVMLPCRTASPGGEVTHIHWLYGGRNVSQTGPRHLILPDNSLLLTNVRMGEAGQYSCVATNQYGESHSNAQVTISRFKVDQFMTVLEGSNVSLSCDLLGAEEGGERGGVEWVKDKNPISSNSGQVLLFKVDHTHQGEYTCTYRKQRFNYYLIIHTPPRITTSSTTVSSKVGAVASLHCVAVGRPEPRVTWHHNGLQLEWGNWHSILTNGTLLVYKVERGRDDGVYTCKAHNTVGMDQLQNTLIIT